MSNKRSAVMPRWLTGFLLLTTFCLLPLGVAYGQDFEAVQKRLGKAVAKGEITLQQANTMMVALKQNAAGTAKVTAAQGDYKRMLAEVQAAVKAGKLSKEQAEAKYAAVKKMYAAQVEQAQAGKAKAAAEYEQFARKLKAAVEAKQITEAEAKAKYDALRKEYARAAELSQAERRALEEKQAEYKAAYADVLNRVKSAIDAGEISPEEGRAKMAAIKREMEARAAAAKIKKAPAAEQAQAAKVEYERAMLKIREAAEAGKISKEEAAQKSAAMRAEIREYEQAAATRAEYQARQAAELEAVMQKIKEALDRGDISREEAEQKLRDLKEKMSSGR